MLVDKIARFVGDLGRWAAWLTKFHVRIAAAISRSFRRWSQCRWCSAVGLALDFSIDSPAPKTRCSKRSIRPCWRWLARARTSATRRRRRSPITSSIPISIRTPPRSRSSRTAALQRQGRDQCRPRLRVAVRLRGLAGQAAATADIAYASYEIALVLDTTGSMKGGKLSSMKDAVLGLIDTMSIAGERRGEAEIRHGPFAAFVNVGPKYGPPSTRTASRSPAAAPAGSTSQGSSSAAGGADAGASRFQLYSNLGQTGRAASRRATRPTRTSTSTTRRPIRRTSRRCSCRPSPSTSPIRLIQRTAISSPTPSRRTRPRRRRRSAGPNTAWRPTRPATR